jgi:hypothetical protein
LQAEALRMFRDMAAGFEEEKAAADARQAELSKLLSAAVGDIGYLTGRVSELEKKLLAAATWEPPVM